jgi:hypothetical protein
MSRLSCGRLARRWPANGCRLPGCGRFARGSLRCGLRGSLRRGGLCRCRLLSRHRLRCRQLRGLGDRRPRSPSEECSARTDHDEMRRLRHRETSVADL